MNSDFTIFITKKNNSVKDSKKLNLNISSTDAPVCAISSTGVPPVRDQMQQRIVLSDLSFVLHAQTGASVLPTGEA